MANVNSTMKNDKLRLVETVQMPATASPTRTNLPITETIRRLFLRLSGTATEGGVGDGTLTAEGVLSLIRNIRVSGTSSSRPEIGHIKNADLAGLYTLQTFLKGISQAILQPTPIAKGSVASPFSVSLPIDFEMPFSQDPRQTLLNTSELTSLALEVDWGAVTDMIGGLGTWTLPTCSLEVYADEFVDDHSKGARYGLNQFSFIETATASANTRLTIDLKRGYMLRGLLVKQFTRTAFAHTPVATVINTVGLEVNREVRKAVSFAALQDMNRDAYQMATVPTGYAFLDLMPEGRYDTIVDTRQFRDVNVVLNVNAVANSFVRVYPVEIIPSLL